MRQFVPCLVLVTLAATPSFAQTPRASTPAPTAPVVVTYADRQAIDEQTPKPATTAPPQNREPGAWQNVKLDVTITDTLGATPTKKTVTMLIVDHGTGRIRSSMLVPIAQGNGSFSMNNSIDINIDANVTLPSARAAELAQKGLAPAQPGAAGQIMLNLTVNYTPEGPTPPSGQSGARPASLDESLNVVVWDGKPTLLAQSADPQSDRKVMLEVTATIIK